MQCASVAKQVANVDIGEGGALSDQFVLPAKGFSFLLPRSAVAAFDSLLVLFFGGQGTADLLLVSSFILRV